MADKDEAAELRELIREAHGAIKDLDRLLAQARQVIRDGAVQARDAAHRATEEELDSFAERWQAEADRHAVSLNEAVKAARLQILKQLMIAELEPMEGGHGLRVKWDGALFDAGDAGGQSGG